MYLLLTRVEIMLKALIILGLKQFLMRVLISLNLLKKIKCN
ncbi:hypothetical protein N39L_11410 [Limnospira platensis NIES-39]|uniref:Uncharacterized protein n=1 Tax=Limnospira platensis NIES-46 TaxID=1236695 RepID=A0A5M3TAL1_LIMPL|nr:hypothetical protein N39L_11410 [Arthrospira platensis NIES-39]GCE94459.1 hypothetical protein NIES46_25140 [Arthrospira platensis NIES-46]